MMPHVKIYLDHFGLTEGDYIPSEVSGLPSVDIHHLDPKGMCGSKQKDYIENLMALTREEHVRAHKEPRYNEYLKEVHEKYLEYHNE